MSGSTSLRFGVDFMNRLLVGVILIVVTARFLLEQCGFIGLCPVIRPGVCMTVYDPVCGIPTFRVHANQCVACMEGAWVWMRNHLAWF